MLDLLELLISGYNHVNQWFSNISRLPPPCLSGNIPCTTKQCSCSHGSDVPDGSLLFPHCPLDHPSIKTLNCSCLFFTSKCSSHYLANHSFSLFLLHIFLSKIAPYISNKVHSENGRMFVLQYEAH